MSKKPTVPFDPVGIPNQLLGDIRQMIEETRTAVAATVNAGLTMLLSSFRIHHYLQIHTTMAVG